MTEASERSFSFDEYLQLEEVSNTKHEFVRGEIYAMASATPRHATVAVAVAVASQLHQNLSGGSCRAYSSDLRIRVTATGLVTYPDVTVVCGDMQTDPASDTTVVNPTVVVEVLSASTEKL